MAKWRSPGILSWNLSRTNRTHQTEDLGIGGSNPPFAIKFFILTLRHQVARNSLRFVCPRS
ncbi:MAG: hypothetical protein EU544_05030 [Promethearchaeota archaeon]|nr:MAG: hypothetical protein EU544_05030 [Candidatus Lokiarchaeota archaeon]